MKPDMKATLYSSALVGLVAHRVRVDVEVVASGGVSRGLVLPDLPEIAAKESRIRVMAALAQLGVELDGVSLKVKLTSDASLQHASGALDLAIAVGAMAAIGKVPASRCDEATLFLGELAMDGGVRAIRGAYAHLAGAADNGFRRAILSVGNHGEAAGYTVGTAEHLRDVRAWLCGEETLPKALPIAPARNASTPFDMSDIVGQALACRALEIAAVGGHSVLLLGAAGTGKTMLARRLTSILPELNAAERDEASKIHSVAGLLGHGAGPLQTRPFRAPHHTVSSTGLVGGGTPARPGEVSLAHAGVLFLDEVHEFRKSTIEALNGSLTQGATRVVSDAGRQTATFPARPWLVGSAPLCSCGWSRVPNARQCKCSPEQIAVFTRRLPTYLFDLVVHVDPVVVAAMKDHIPGESSAEVRERVVRAREFARREGGTGDVARTIADLDGSSNVMARHMEEAQSFRAQ
jgi:magnesium chelatase family protein